MLYPPLALPVNGNEDESVDLQCEEVKILIPSNVVDT